MIHIDDPELYADWSAEKLQDHINKLKAIRAAKLGALEHPRSVDDVRAMLDPNGSNFLGSGMTSKEFMIGTTLARFNASFFRQGSAERRRRCKYTVELGAQLKRIKVFSMQGIALAEGAIADVIEGSWYDVRAAATDWSTNRGLEYIGIARPEHQELWKQFAQILQQAFETRPEAPQSNVVKN